MPKHKHIFEKLKYYINGEDEKGESKYYLLEKCKCGKFRSTYIKDFE